MLFRSISLDRSDDLYKDPLAHLRAIVYPAARVMQIYLHSPMSQAETADAVEAASCRRKPATDGRWTNLGTALAEGCMH